MRRMQPVSTSLDRTGHIHKPKQGSAETQETYYHHSVAGTKHIIFISYSTRLFL